ncbi:MAG: ribosome-associated translation inhibitor RaiA [Candidatus Binataceae bacterium]|jgi:putative sigma-54 modulation protein
MSLKSSNSRKKKLRRATIPPTEVNVTFRHVEPTAAIQQYAERKLGHISKFLKRETQAHLILEVDKYRQRGEVTVKSGRLAVFAEAETKDLYSVIDLLVDKVERQLKKNIDKVQAKKTRASSTGEVLTAAEEGSESSPPASGANRS